MRVWRCPPADVYALAEKIAGDVGVAEGERQLPGRSVIAVGRRSDSAAQYDHRKEKSPPHTSLLEVLGGGDSARPERRHPAVG